MIAVDRVSAVLAEIEVLEELLASARRQLQRSSAMARHELAGRVYRMRRQRDAVFGTDATVFGEPAWDMLLDLYQSRQRGGNISVTSACIGSSAAASTALRHLRVLEERGLVRRVRDGSDGRRTFTHLSDGAVKLIDRWLDLAAVSMQQELKPVEPATGRPDGLIPSLP
ncbi:hypothetical protein SAMN06297144_1201 [Sphingomonas guangdongensis]|uniref:HTH marR-type domain-containing protein n=1 Tax=Sphingomonas guangdongensis TaxID=1141890 RepID=A0A285QKX1_9SPHN|nr:hypothetical protein [Sphingomonas guangdongensis]SOB80712.1 hypothetical protein SAMN06297144_1201 [Sphingomonas guangdongensis]